MMRMVDVRTREKCLEQREEDKSPQGAQNELDVPGSEAATPNDAHRH